MRETHRLTRWVERADQAKEIAVELYDEAADPEEMHNIAADPANAAIRADLTRQLADGWRAAIPKK